MANVGSDAAREPAIRRGLGGIGFLLDALRRRRGGRLALWGLVAALALGGIGMLVFPFFTHWQAKRIQGGLEQKFEAAPPPETQTKLEWQRSVANKDGAPLTRLKIPRLKVDVIVVEGVSWNALKAGAGHYPGTALPGEPGNVSIAGHRTGFGEPFRHVDRLRSGDSIILETPHGIYTYQLTPAFDGHPNPWITHARDFSVVQPTVVPSLTLTTCDPPGTSKNRLIVRARLVRSQARA